MKKVKYLLFLIASFAFSYKVNALVDSVKINELNGVEGVINGSVVTDSKYAFTFKATAKTTIDASSVNKDEFTFFNESDNSFYALPKADASKREFTVKIDNVGYYNGKDVDLELIYKWKNLDFELNGEDVTTVPAIGLTLDRTSGLILHSFYTGSYEVNYKLYQDGEPLKINMALFLKDIDGGQYYALKANTGKIANIQATKSSVVYGFNDGGYTWFYDKNNVLVGDDPDLNNTVRFEFEDTDNFSLIVGCEVDMYSYKDYISIPRHVLDPDNTEEVNQSLYDRYNTLVNPETRSSATYGAVVATSDSYGPYSLPTPFKYVKTTSSNAFKENASLNSDEETITYNLTMFVPKLYSDYYYSSYVLTDEVNKDLKISGVEVLNENGEKITDSFEVSISDNVLVVKAKENLLSSVDFYEKTYFVNFEAVLSDTAKKDMETNGTIIIENDFTVSALEKGKSDPTVVRSNKTLTTLGTYKIETEVINGTIDPTVDVVFIGSNVKINFSANEGYKLIAIYIDGEKIEITGDETSYLFENIDNSHRIKVVYEIENPDLGAFVNWSLLILGGAGALYIIYRQKKKNVFFRL